ncbi:MAG: LPS export ABC transporter ATP-binding protein [Pseudomonadota bacterium]
MTSNISPSASAGTGLNAEAALAAEASRPKVVEGDGGLLAENLAKSFKRRPVVRGVSMRVNRGEVVGLLGPNGAGKTTCFYMITGLIPVDYGRIMIDGLDATRLPMYQRARLGVGYLPQEASIFRGLTVEQNLRAVIELVERNKDKQQALIDDLLTEFNITHIRSAPALALSGGERRRVEIARALATGPAFMLLDEPFAGIDPLAIADIRELVTHLRDRGLGVLITDHNVRETLDIIDRAYIIHEGQVLIEGAPDDIVGDKDVRRVYLGDGFQM